MNPLTIYGVEPQLEQRIRAVAAHEGISPSEAALHLLRKGAGTAPRLAKAEPAAIGASLDRFFGTWSADEADEFDASIRAFGQTDESH